MPTIPDANVSISATANALAGGTGYCIVVAPVSKNADTTPRVYSSGKGILDQHDYAPGVDYGTCHIGETRKPIIFVGIPIATPGVVGRQDGSRVAGSSAISVAAGASGALEEVDAIVTITSAGTVGQPGIKGTISMDGGTTEKAFSLGAATSYVIPYLGLTLSFTGGDLHVGDVYTFSTTAPMWDQAGIEGARAALAAQQNPARSWMAIGDVPTHTVAGFVTSAINNYETSKKRFSYARVQVRDRLPLASMARQTVRMTGAATLTFAEVGGTGDTITRSTGSWIDDGFAVGMFFTVSGSVSNNVSDKIASLSATVITLGSTDLAAEGPVAGVVVVASPAITFAEVGGTGDTITRSGGGSWLDDGFAAGDILTIAGTGSNNVTTDAIVSVTSTVITLNTTDLAAEVIGSRSFTITKGETMAAWVSAMATEFASVSGQKRVSLGLGRLRHASPITGWELRRPVQWAASIREYQHDVHHPTWAKADGPLKDWSNTDEHNNVVEYDEDTDGGALAAGFTCARTWGNGPVGPFIAMDLTRDTEGSTLSLVHNLAVANVFCTVVQATTEDVIGQTPVLNDDGTATSAALQVIEEKINSAVKQALLREFVPGEGPRASLAVWEANATDDLRPVDATLTGAGDLVVNGTVVHVNTQVAVS